MIDIANEKVIARKAAFARRAAAHSASASRAGVENLLRYLDPHKGRAIAGYMPIRTEIDPRSAMAELARFAPVAVPVVIGAGAPLEFHRWRPDAAMKAGAFGAEVPVEVEIIRPEIIILPLVAFDRAGRRLGYGGGFYDRTLEKLRKTAPVLAVGFAYSAQEAVTLPAEDTDQPLDAIVTENGAMTF